MTLEWRKLEQTLVSLARAGGLEVEEKRASGDICVQIHGEINLTDFAKELVIALEPPVAVRSTPKRG